MKTDRPSKTTPRKNSGSKLPTRSLSAKHLAALDLLITTAQARGAGLRTRLSNTEEQAEAQAEVHEAMWEARHGGFEISAVDRRTLRRIRQLASRLEVAPTLGQLIELRGQALKAQLQG